MSIQRKFAILLGLVGLSVAISLAASTWAVTLFQHELSEPFQATASVLNKLDDLTRTLESFLQNLEQGDRSATPPVDLGALARRLDDDTQALLGDELSVRRLGVGAARTLEERMRQVRGRLTADPELTAASNDWLRSAVPEDIALMQRLANHALADAQLAVSHGEQIRRQLLIVLTLSGVLAIMMCSLGLILVKRWILRPIGTLRTAAERIGAGDYAHRIPAPRHSRDEIAQLSSEVNDMARLVARMQKERIEQERLAAMGEMVRRLAHNIRNPLSGIRGLAEITSAELKPDSELSIIQSRIIATVDSFEEWLADLLETTSPLSLEPTEHTIQPWLEHLVESHRAMAQDRGVDLVLDCQSAPPRAIFDSRRLSQAIVAIISNAIEVAPKDSSVRIVADKAQTKNHAYWIIQIEDEGPGVPHDLVNRIFAANFTTKPTGHGIGLAYARQVVRLHHGRIFVHSPNHSEKNEALGHVGAIIVMRLPVEPPTVKLDEDSGEHLNGDTSGENSHH